jgi:hypothetical protein
MPQSYWSTVTYVEQVMGQTKKGKPVLNVTTSTGKKLSLLGVYELLAKIRPGAEIQHSEPSEFNGRHYATLELIQPPAAAAKPATQPPASNGNRSPAAPASATWDDIRRVANAAKDLAWAIEPDVGCDPKTNDQYVSCATARAAIINTIMIAFTNGRVQAPKDALLAEIPGLDAPMPDDEGFPWERAVDTA